MASYECGQVVKIYPSRFAHNYKFDCISANKDLTFWNLWYGIALEAFLWGFGTALGELPPYLVSRAAALNGKIE